MKKIIFIVLILAIIFPFMGNVSAAGVVGVSPGNVIFENVLRNGYAERFITITIDSENPINILTEPRGEIESWLEIPSNLTVSKDDPGRLLIAVSPPTDIPNGNYTGFLRISTEALNEGGAEGHAVSAVRAVLDVAITVEITDLEILQCRANNFEAFSAEKGDEARFDINIFNNGNIRLRPNVVIDIWDQDQIGIVKTVELKGEEILPTREERLSFNLETNDLDLDQYWAEVNVVECFSSETLTFDVLEPGALKAEGILLKIFSKAWSEVDETIPIVADFKNTGEKDLDAKFKGEITREGRIVQVIESEEAIVPIGQATNFTFFFTPQKAGRYVASGRIFYDKKRTFESSTIINIGPKKFGFKQVILTVLYIAIFFVIAILFYKIRKERGRYMEKIRRIKNET